MDGNNGAICLWDDGSPIIATGSYSNDGQVHNHIGASDFWVFKTDNSGNIVWDNCFGGSNNTETPFSICKASDGTIWYGGLSASNDGHVGVSYGGGDAWMVRSDSLGNYLSSRVLGTIAFDELTLLYPLSNGIVLAGGNFQSSGLGGVETQINWNGASDLFISKIAPWTTFVESTTKESIQLVYPNPANDRIFIDAVKYDLKIVDVLGRNIYKANGMSGKNSISVSDWQRGLYFVQVEQEGKATMKPIYLE